MNITTIGLINSKQNTKNNQKNGTNPIINFENKKLAKVDLKTLQAYSNIYFGSKMQEVNGIPIEFFKQLPEDKQVEELVKHNDDGNPPFIFELAKEPKNYFDLTGNFSIEHQIALLNTSTSYVYKREKYCLVTRPYDGIQSIGNTLIKKDKDFKEAFKQLPEENQYKLLTARTMPLSSKIFHQNRKLFIEIVNNLTFEHQDKIYKDTYQSLGYYYGCQDAAPESIDD